MKQDDTDVLKVVGINSMGYGTIPKLVMKDRRLTPEAKCIYGYFASYAGSGNSAFPTVSKVIYDLCVSEKRYYKHFKLLTHYGYISVEQVKVKGKFTHNLYNLNMEITEKKPSSQNDCTEKPSSRFAWTQNARTQNVGTNNNSLNNNSLEEEEGQAKNQQKETGEAFPKHYIEMALEVGATKEELAIALEKMDSEPDIKNRVAWLQKALKNEVINRELTNRPKTEKKSASKRTTPRSVRVKADIPSEDSRKEKYEKFYL